MSKSLHLQGIDSKIDGFAVKQTSSQKTTNSYLEKIQERIQAFEALQKTDLAQTMEISMSSSQDHETLHDIQNSQVYVMSPQLRWSRAEGRNGFMVLNKQPQLQQ